MTNIEARRFERYDINRKVFYRTSAEADYKQGRTSNISKTGLLLESGEIIPKGGEIEFAININGTAVYFKGTCIYCLGNDLEGFHTGIKILKINTAGMKTFLAFIKAFEKRHTEKNRSLKFEGGDVDSLVQRIAGEHKLITHYVIALQEMMAASDPYPESAEYEAIMNLMKKDLIAHFYIEDKIFFKIGLTHLPSKYHGIIGELTVEHDEMTHELERVIENIEELARVNAPVDRKMKTSIKIFLERLKDHARKEIIDLFPLMEENAEVKSRIFNALQGAIKEKLAG